MRLKQLQEVCKKIHLEHQLIPSMLSDVEYPNIENCTDMKQTIITNIGVLNLYGKNEGNVDSIYLVKNNKIIGGLSFTSLPNYDFYQAIKTKCDIPQKGIISELILWIKKNLNLQLISDCQMTLEGQALWKNLCKKNIAKVINIKTNKSYSYSEIDNKNTFFPEFDNFQDEIYNKSTNTGQIWFYGLNF